MNIKLPKLNTVSLKSLFIATLVVSLSVSGASTLFAQADAQTTSGEPASSLTAVPTRLGDDHTLRVKPGEKTQVEVRIINSSANTMNVITSAEDFIVGEDGSTPIAVRGTDDKANRWSLASWLVMTPTEQTIASRRTAIVNVLIEVPEDALPGGHYAMITHQPTLASIDGDGNSAAAGVNQKVGTLLYLVVEGPINEEAYVTDFSFPKFSEYGPVPYSFTVDNRSDVHITPQIGINIKNIFGQTVETIQPETKNIFPLTARTYEGKWNRIWGFGPYTAQLTMSFGTEGKVVIAYSKFWLLPLKLIIAISIIILTAIAIGISVRRHMIHRRQDQTKRIVELEQKLQDLEKDKLKKFEE